MITSNVLQRVLQISGPVGGTGTGFILDWDGRQYMVTASHVLGAVSGAFELRIRHNAQWKSATATVVGHAPFESDITVLALPQLMVAPEIQLPLALRYAYGQDVYFLGFPFGDGLELGEMNNHYPAAFVKRAIISGINSGGRPSIVYLDGHNNPGFSGGPVVARNPETNVLEVISIISGYRFTSEQIQHRGSPIPDTSVNINTGIIISYGICHSREIMSANPIGYPLDGSD